MLKARKVQPPVFLDRMVVGGSDLGVEGTVLVETPTAKLVWLPGHTGYGDRINPSRYVPVSVMSVRPSGKVTTVASGGRFDLERFAKLLPRICEELKADVAIGDIDLQHRAFTTVFEEA